MGAPVGSDGRTVWPSGTRPSGSRFGAVATPVVATAAIAAAVTATLVFTGAPFPAALTVAVTVPAAAVDLRERRLPDAWLAAALGVLLFGLAAAGATVSTSLDDRLAAALAGALAMATPLLILHLLSPAAMGFGDVKAASVLGAALGTVDWRLTLAALAVAAGTATVFGALRRSPTLPFGPFLVLGAAVALGASEPLVAALIGDAR
jgi:leader peptidase (prepilin peptidase) / N-methyltransferase